MEATALPAPVRLLHVQGTTVGAARAACLAILGMHAQLQFYLPVSST